MRYRGRLSQAPLFTHSTSQPLIELLNPRLLSYPRFYPHCLPESFQHEGCLYRCKRSLTAAKQPNVLTTICRSSRTRSDPQSNCHASANSALTAASHEEALANLYVMLSPRPWTILDDSEIRKVRELTGLVDVFLRLRGCRKNEARAKTGCGRKRYGI
jgi:hypothetical protein